MLFERSLDQLIVRLIARSIARPLVFLRARSIGRSIAGLLDRQLTARKFHPRFAVWRGYLHECSRRFGKIVVPVENNQCQLRGGPRLNVLRSFKQRNTEKEFAKRVLATVVHEKHRGSCT